MKWVSPHLVRLWFKVDFKFCHTCGKILGHDSKTRVEPMTCASECHLTWSDHDSKSTWSIATLFPTTYKASPRPRWIATLFQNTCKAARLRLETKNPSTWVVGFFYRNVRSSFHLRMMICSVAAHDHLRSSWYPFIVLQFDDDAWKKVEMMCMSSDRSSTVIHGCKHHSSRVVLEYHSHTNHWFLADAAVA